jgi:hypothetical protein
MPGAIADPASAPFSSRYRGPGWFGPAYATMIRRDPHARGSIDRRILESCVGLDADTAPSLYRDFTSPRVGYIPGRRPVLEAIGRGLVDSDAPLDQRIRAVPRFFRAIAAREAGAIDTLRFGGTEEEIIARGSNWCTDVSRAACALYHVMGVPSRIVLLADTRKAYSGHAIVEAYRARRWGAVDCVANVVYQSRSGQPASTWDLMKNSGWIDHHYRDRRQRSVRRGQFRRAAIANYSLRDPSEPDYRTSRVTPYYRSILRMSERGWPGGLRWLHGEDRSSRH